MVKSTYKDELPLLTDNSTTIEINIPDFDCLLDMIESSYDSFSNTHASLEEDLSVTIERKMEVEVDVQSIYEDVLAEGSNKFPQLTRRAHITFCHGFLSHPLPNMFAKLDASKTWICYWLMNSVILLGTELVQSEKNNASKLLSFIYNTSIMESDNFKGFGGGPFQLPHLAASYAGVSALALSDDEVAWAKIDTSKVKEWLLSMKAPNGSFSMHKGGETDTRAAYCALSIASLFNILDNDLNANLCDWLISCQTYEGGFGGEPNDEAHGGYTYCALAALLILMTPQELLNSKLDFESLVKWTVDRQFSLEGGFSGRSNKLVDGCYGHWIGGTVALLELIINQNRDAGVQRSLIDRQRLQNYILCCCQDRMGLRDKPGCKSDFYHTNYVLCGLSMTQHFQVYDSKKALDKGNAFCSYPVEIRDSKIVDVKSTNKVKPLDAIFGLPYGVAENMFKFYSKK